MGRSRAAMLVVALVVGVITVTATPAYAKTVNVPSGGSIQAAVDAAKPGDTIALTNGGAYAGGVAISKDNITIKGNGATVEGTSAPDSQCLLLSQSSEESD